MFKGLSPIVYGGREVWPLVEGGKGVSATNHASSGAWAAAGGIGDDGFVGEAVGVEVGVVEGELVPADAQEAGVVARDDLVNGPGGQAAEAGGAGLPDLARGEALGADERGAVGAVEQGADGGVGGGVEGGKFGLVVPFG